MRELMDISDSRFSNSENQCLVDLQMRKFTIARGTQDEDKDKDKFYTDLLRNPTSDLNSLADKHKIYKDLASDSTIDNKTIIDAEITIKELYKSELINLYGETNYQNIISHYEQAIYTLPATLVGSGALLSLDYSPLNPAETDWHFYRYENKQFFLSVTHKNFTAKSLYYDPVNIPGSVSFQYNIDESGFTLISIQTDSDTLEKLCLGKDINIYPSTTALMTYDETPNTTSKQELTYGKNLALNLLKLIFVLAAIGFIAAACITPVGSVLFAVALGAGAGCSVMSCSLFRLSYTRNKRLAGPNSQKDSETSSDETSSLKSMEANR